MSAGAAWPRAAVAALAVAALAALGVLQSAEANGRALVFALGLGAAFGVVLQRSRFCFFCHARDYFDPADGRADARGLLSILLAIAVGTVGMHLVYAGWMPVIAPDRLPADAHIGPVSWALVLAGIAFGLGMVVSGSCLSAHWYRLGEGSPVAPFALLGGGLGFVLGFQTWNPLYSLAVAGAPPWWLPHLLGHTGSAIATLLVLAVLGAWLARRGLPPRAAAAAAPQTAGELIRRVFGPGRWPYWIGGLAVGWIATVVLLRLRPLGVTAALGAASRDIGSAVGAVPARLDGLDMLRGCATLLESAVWRTPNAMLVVGLVGGALAAALLAGQFLPRRPRPSEAARGLVGGLLLGWGAMTGLGCTIGTLLSGTMAGAVSGWVFGAAVLAAVWSGLKLGWAPPR